MQLRFKPFKTVDWIILALVFFAVVLLNYFVPSFDLRQWAGGVPANIVVDTQAVGTPVSTDFFHAFTQGGEEKIDMLAPVVEKVKALHPRFIRIDHIFDFYTSVTKGSADIQIDFTTLDGIVDTIGATGAAPVLSLSYMPAAIAKEGVITNPPDNWSDWSSLIQKTIEHYSGKHQKNISGIYYEVWNEPDLSQFGKWGLGGEHNYLTLYRLAAVGAAAADDTQPFLLGGPATTDFYKNWISKLLESGSRVDFISWHSYHQDPANLAANVHELGDSLPILITEYGFTGSRDERYGTAYAAAYTAAVVRQLLDNPTPPTIFAFQLKDGPDQNNGWGLIAHESVGAATKPRYHVFSFFDAVKGMRLNVSGEGSWVSAIVTKDGETIRVLLVNYDADERHAETFPVTFTHLTPGTYMLRQRYFLGVDATTSVAVPTSTLTKQIYLSPNQLMILEFKRKVI